MDYAKIYEDLIESRKMRPRLEDTYYEKHHILPRCLGGGDEESNLVYLPAREHFIAHLLLAHIHGGKLWFAAQAMKLTVGGREIRYGRCYEIVRREFSRMMGELMKDHTVREYVDCTTGEKFSATQSELQQNYGLSCAESSRLANGKMSFARGVATAESGRGVAPPDPKYDFIEAVNGKVHSLTVAEVVEKFNLTVDRVKSLIAGRSIAHKGISLVGGATSKRRAAKVFEFRDITTGKVFNANYKDMLNSYGMYPACFAQLTTGKILTSFGVCLSSTADEDIPTRPEYTVEHVVTGEVITGTSAHIKEVTDMKPSLFGSLTTGLVATAKGYRLLHRPPRADAEEIAVPVDCDKPLPKKVRQHRERLAAQVVN